MIMFLIYISFDNNSLKSFNFKPRIGYKLANNALVNAANGTMFIGHTR